MYVFHVRTCLMHQEARRGVGYPDARVAGCELLTNAGKQHVLLTASPSLQARLSILKTSGQKTERPCLKYLGF